MKYSQLSNFQKQQYTNYLQTQLQKFSSFMLAQKRENDKYRLLEDAISYQSNMFSQMQEKVQLIQLYQRQNHDSFEHFSKKMNRFDDIEAKIRHLEDRQRFGCDDKSNKKSRMNKKMYQNTSEQEQEVNSIIIEANYKDCMKIIKKQQAELSDCQDALRKITKNRLYENKQYHTIPQDSVQKKDLKKLQKRVIRYINDKIGQFENKRHRSRSKSTKSRSAKAGQLSVIDNYTIKQSKKGISSFRIEEDVANKSQMSTLLESKSTKRSRISQKDTKKMKKKSVSKSISKDKKKNRSRSKINDKKQSKDNGRNKSRSIEARNRSFSLSDQSIIHSSRSRSHSKISKHQRSKSRQSNLSKHSKHTKHSKRIKKSQSKQKSHSNSHELCKKRPQPVLNLLKRIPQMKKQTIPLRKRKPLQTQRYK